jgi:hypothetical protein
MTTAETAWEKTVRKFKSEPLVPIGTLLTTACLLLENSFFISQYNQFYSLILK